MLLLPVVVTRQELLLLRVEHPHHVALATQTLHHIYEITFEYLVLCKSFITWFNTVQRIKVSGAVFIKHTVEG